MSDLNYNFILDTDSYKASHFLQYPEDTSGLFDYIESRGGMYDDTVFFGLQYILKRYLSQRITKADVDEAEEIFTAHGEPFNREGWMYIVQKLGGKLPLEVRAIPEGTVVPVKNALVTVESTDNQVSWLTSYAETMLLRVWYPMTVATQSWDIKQIIRHYLEETSEDVAGQLLFKLHDFGARGVSSYESSGIGGLAHLVNFRGTDTVPALRVGRHYYGADMAGFSIAASEHSTITSWGRENELQAYRNMIRQFAKPGKLFACVADSYDLYNAVSHLFGEVLREDLVSSEALLVVRPDSGNPVEVSLATAKMLRDKFGATRNKLGYDVLNNVRIIYGDGINATTIRGILMELKAHGFSADNIAFGMGGALLQQVNRDTQKMAMKTSAIEREERGWLDVYKDPITDPGKASKKGRLSTYQNVDTGAYQTCRLGEQPEGFQDALRTVFRNGELLIDDNLETIRSRSER